MLNGLFFPSTVSTTPSSARMVFNVATATSDQFDSYTNGGQNIAGAVPNVSGSSGTVYTPVRVQILIKQVPGVAPAPINPIYKLQRVRGGVTTDLTTNINWTGFTTSDSVTISTALVGGVTLLADDVVKVVPVSGSGTSGYLYTVNIEATYTPS